MAWVAVRFCIKNEELCIKNDEFCIKNEELCIKNDEFCRDRKHAKAMRKKAAELDAKRKADAAPPRAVLKDIDLRVEAGVLCCVVGRVGSGKSALLQSILGEMLKLEGTVRVSGNVSFASQSAFILNATVRENVLFCSP